MFRIKDITLIAILSAVLIVMDFALSYIPVVQVVVLLIMVYSRVLKTPKTLLIVLIYVLGDCLISGSFGITIILPMFIGWSFIPIIMHFIRTDNIIILALFSILFSLLYCWCFAIFNIFLLHINLREYLIADIYFEIALAVSSFISVLWLFKPITKFLNKQLQ